MIKGLTDRGAAFPRIGTLRKGAPKPENGKAPGRDLDYFRFTSEPPDPDLEKEFATIYGPQPNAIRIYLGAGLPEENFMAWREEWVAGGLKHRCDGETCVVWLGPDGKYSQEAKKCPGGCKPVGRLSVIIRDLKRFGCVTVLTTSIHDIMTIQESLDAMMRLMPGGHLVGIPFILTRKPRLISTPGADGKRVRREKSLIFIEPDPEWFRLQIESHRRRAMLAAGADVVTGEIVAPLALTDGSEEAPAEGDEGEPGPPDNGNGTHGPDRTEKPARAGGDKVELHRKNLAAAAVESPATTTPKIPERPWPPEFLLTRLVKLTAYAQDNKRTADPGLFGACIDIMDKCGDRHTFLRAAFGVDSVTRLTEAQKVALVTVIKPEKWAEGNEWIPVLAFKTEFAQVVAQELEGEGQEPLFPEAEAA